MIRKRGSPILHFLDRYAGIPAIAILGHLRRKRNLPSKIGRIGLLRTAAIGDTVLLGAVIADLRSAFPGASLIFFAGPSNIAMARMLDGIDTLVEIPIGNLSVAMRRVRSAAVDVLIDFGQWPRFDALLAALSGPSFTIGFRTPGQYRHYGYDRIVDHSSEVHEIENFRTLVQALGVKTGNSPNLRKPQSDPRLPANYAVLHLWPGGSRKTLKQWPDERWIALVEEFAGKGTEVVLTGAPADHDANKCIIDRVPLRARSFVRNAAGLSLPETAALLAHSRIVVSVDTGVMHMAAALGVPLVALHGPTSSKRWGPVSESAIAVDSSLVGSGYLNLGWERSPRRLKCMECIRYEEVRDACRSILGKQVEPAQVMQTF